MKGEIRNYGDMLLPRKELQLHNIRMLRLTSQYTHVVIVSVFDEVSKAREQIP